ncbi:MAG: glycosyltransferase family 39 protein [Candidatus Beckwithbacteria bacterium]
MKLKYFGIVSILLLYVFLSKSLLLVDPIVFPDETLFATVGYSLVAPDQFSSNWFSTHLAQAEASEMIYHGPLYYYFLAGVFKFFSFGINQLRLASLVLGLVSLGLIYWLLTRMKEKNDQWTSLLGMLVVGSDYFFLRSSRFGRQEMMVIMFSLLGLVSYFSWLKKKSSWNLGLVCLALLGAFFTHYLLGLVIVGTILIDRLLTEKKKIVKDRLSWGVVLSIFGGALVWGLKVFQIRQEIEKMVGLGVARLVPTFRSVRAILAGDSLMKLVVATYLLSLVVLSLLKNKSRFEKVIMIYGWLSIGILVYGGLDWYLGLFGIVGGLSMYGVSQFFRRKGNINGQYLMIMVMVVMVIVNLVEQGLIKRWFADYDYDEYGEKVSSLLPNGAKVWVRQLMPDPSLYLAEKRPDLHLIFEGYNYDLGVKNRQQLDVAEYMVVYEVDEVLRSVKDVNRINETRHTSSLKVVRLK